MKVGDLVMMDDDGSAHGKVGIVVVKRECGPAYSWERAKRFEYDVLIEGRIWACSYSDLLEQEDWPIEKVIDETR